MGGPYFWLAPGIFVLNHILVSILVSRACSVQPEWQDIKKTTLSIILSVMLNICE